MDAHSQKQFLLENTRGNKMHTQENLQEIDPERPSQSTIVPIQGNIVTPSKILHRDGLGRLQQMVAVSRGEFYLRPKDGRLVSLRVQQSDRIVSKSPLIMKIIRCVKTSYSE